MFLGNIDHFLKLTMMKGSWIVGTLALALSISCAMAQKSLKPIPKPKGYVCYRTTAPVTIDGKLDEKDWANAEWTDAFIDIEGSEKPTPRFKTRAKMLWDDKYLYVSAELEEPHLWGKLTKDESIIYYDNDFEIFIDPNSDTHLYHEFEINVLGTKWDLMLDKPYREGGLHVNGWDMKGLKSAVSVDGTINDPSDTDKGWSVEVALPLASLSETQFGRALPRHGTQWRINFSRVEWKHEIKKGKYVKKRRENGKRIREDNWVWSPQYLINMHYPERWGFLQFSDKKVGGRKEPFKYDQDEIVRLWMYEVYYAQRSFRHKKGRYAKTFQELGVTDFTLDGKTLESPWMDASERFFEATVTSPFSGRVCHIRFDGKSWFDSRRKRKRKGA
ncbi:hypothetical protein FUAX_52020 (plasmid) [Fulvitalea axinellae]|uniref:Carbohydrate-binding domain-containing protein n=1 Tax=Fulvitalea axinellae TaxID=1182444 RepID=A0AAU9CUM7_9BACT|nr:hypothetical protein FUAX_52020 [Fulvitalea axinellae]